jgi:hypothetical protein
MWQAMEMIPPEIHGGLMVDFGKEQVILPG